MAKQNPQHPKRKNEIIRVGSAEDAAAQEKLSPKPFHGDPQVHAKTSQEAFAKRESGAPGGGAGRRDDVGRTGVYPISGDERPSGKAELRPLGDWAGGDRGIAGYEDSGGSELVMREGQLLGGLTSDGSGRPTIDIHGKPPETDDSAKRTIGDSAEERMESKPRRKRR
jgi:hypothetical protein